MNGKLADMRPKMRTKAPEKREVQKNRPRVLNRAAGCAALLALLGVSGFLGAGREAPVRMTAAPVMTRTVTGGEGQSMEEIRDRLSAQREAEIALLDSVSGDAPQGDAQAQAARAQKASLAARMETEAQIAAAAAYMGYGEIGVVCGAGMATIFAGEAAAGEGALRLIEAAADIAQIEPSGVKIILVKK